MNQKQEQNFYRLQNKFDTIVCIGRGGMLPSLLLSHSLSIKDVQMINLSSYVDKSNGEIKKHNGVKLDVLNKKVLIVDDLVETGNTLKQALTYCKDASEIRTFVVFYKQSSIIKPDYYFKIVRDEWIDFSYEKNQNFYKWFK